MTDLNTEVILTTDFCNGKQHDFQLFTQGRNMVAEQIYILADAGCQGLADLHSNSQTPAKKSKLHLLSSEQKASNRKLSKKRILIENIIRKLKIFRILSERYHNQRKRFGLRFSLIAAIYNFELEPIHDFCKRSNIIRRRQKLVDWGHIIMFWAFEQLKFDLHTQNI